MNDNALTARFFDRSALSENPDPAKIGRTITVENLDGSYPGGFGAASLKIACDPTMPMPFLDGDFVKVFNGVRIVYEGYIASVGHWYQRNAAGVTLKCLGAWGWLMAKNGVNKPWADDRITQDAWRDELPTGYSDTNRDRFTTDRTNRLRIDTKAAALAVNDGRSMTYSMPPGQTIKRVKSSYNYQEGALNMGFRLFNVASATNVYNLTASGSGTRDDTLGTPSQHVFITLYSSAVQTGLADGSIFGQIDNAVSGATALMVYSETGSINCYEVFKDVRAMVSDLSADESMLDSTLTVTVEPFITQGREAYASILSRIAGIGSSSSGSIAYGIRTTADSTDGKPILFCEPYRDLTDYEWEINVADKQINDDIEIVRDLEAVVNWVSVTYRDAAGIDQTVTPDDDATLKDTDSIAKYGQRELQNPLNVGQIGRTAAIAYGKRYLAMKKDVQVYVSGFITYSGWVPGKNGTRIPAADAVADVITGVRAKVTNFVSDVLDISGAGLTAYVTNAEYTDMGGGQVRLSFGYSDDLSAILAQIPQVQSLPAKSDTRLTNKLVGDR